MPEGFLNLAGADGADFICVGELQLAGIKISRLPEMFREKREVKTVIIGEIGPWGFTRAWRYWIAKGPGIPPEIAADLHVDHGEEVRVGGHCGCPSPKERFKGFAVGLYHVDTQEGLNALAEVVRGIGGES